MVDISRAQPHVARIGIVVVCLLTVFLFFDPIGFASSPMADHMPGTTRGVTHIVMFQFKRDADPAVVDLACARMMSLKEVCLSPNSNYAYIKDITGGKDHSQEGKQHGFTHAFVVQFANTDDRNYYVEKDPVHDAFKKMIGAIVEKVGVLDFANGNFH